MMTEKETLPTALDLCVRHNDMNVLPRGRDNCPSCNKRSQWYCGSCFLPTIDTALIPCVKLPIRVDVLRGREEKDSKSTAAHVAVMSKEDTSVWRLPDFPKYQDAKKVLLLYPSPTSIPASSIDFSKYEALMVVDTTWNKASGVMQLPELAQPFQHVHLDDYHTLFWRYQPLGPACLSTIEALYFFFREALIGKKSRELEEEKVEDRCPSKRDPKNPTTLVACIEKKKMDTSNIDDAGTNEEIVIAGGIPESEKVFEVVKRDPQSHLYDGRYDNLLFFFLAQYNRIQFEYTAGKKKGFSFTQKMRENYIQDANSCEEKQELENQSRKEQRRRARVRGGWSIRTDVMSENVAQVHDEINSRFLSYGKRKKRKTFEKVNEIVEDKDCDVRKGQLAAYTVISGKRHKYGTVLNEATQLSEDQIVKINSQNQAVTDGMRM